MPLPIMLLLLVVAQSLDYTTFLVMIGRHGLEAELNPLAVMLVETTGLGGLTLAKMAAVLFAAASAVIILRRRRTLGGVVLGFGIGAGMLGAFSNVISF
ncbi:hypothetical protein BH24CHL6_BH24CHL6_03030 [soil metagenome]